MMLITGNTHVILMNHASSVHFLTYFNKAVPGTGPDGMSSPQNGDIKGFEVLGVQR